MVYLDYSATTKVDAEVLLSFNKVTNEYIGNANSLHKLGFESHKLMRAATKQIADLLAVDEKEVVFTSGATESNNLAIFGVINKYSKRGKHIITTKFEHSSVLEPIYYLEKNGYKVDYLEILEDGLIDLDDLKKKITDETVLVSICHVNSEIGLIQDVNKIGELLNKYPRVIFHVDGTQAIGKISINLKNVDLYSFSAHKFYGLKGSGCLIKKRHIELMPIIYGGNSQSIYRSGTPDIPNYVAIAKALKLALSNLEEKQNHVLNLNNYLISELKKIENVIINSNRKSIPHIINISVLGIKSETMLHALEAEDIFVSTKTACSSDKDYSLSVYELTKNLDLSKRTLRISLSHLTTKEELDFFIKIFKQKMNELISLKGEQ